MRQLAERGYTNLLTASRDELDLRRQSAVEAWFHEHRPEYVYLVAGTVGGILANSTRPADFIFDNMMIHATVVHAAWTSEVHKLLYLGSSCIYPREAPQPMREDYLLTGPLEPTNAPYAVAKIAGIQLCQAYRKQYGCDFISGMPTNLYGPGDNFDPESSHVIPGLIRKFHDAKMAGESTLTVWGTGSPRREFMHVDDLADACIFLMDHYDGDQHVNIGTGEEVTIAELAEMIRRIVHPEAELVFDSSKPDGTPRKLLDNSRIHALGWRHSMDFEAGLRRTCEWYIEHHEQAPGQGAGLSDGAQDKL